MAQVTYSDRTGFDIQGTISSSVQWFHDADAALYAYGSDFTYNNGDLTGGLLDIATLNLYPLDGSYYWFVFLFNDLSAQSSLIATQTYQSALDTLAGSIASAMDFADFYAYDISHITSGVIGYAGGDEFTTLSGAGIGELVAAFDNTGALNSKGGDDYVYSRSEETVIRSGSGNDMIEYIGPTFLTDIGRFDGEATIRSGNGDDIIDASGTKLTISGGSGNDSIYFDADVLRVGGGSGNDYIDFWDGEDAASKSNLNGQSGDDTIFGHFGNDNIRGGSGEDVLQSGYNTDTFGGMGKDQLRGGSDSDIFAFVLWDTDTTTDGDPVTREYHGGVAVVRDFDATEDLLFLETQDTWALTAAQQLDMFLEHAEQRSGQTVYNDGVLTIKLKGVVLDDITIDNFFDF